MVGAVVRWVTGLLLLIGAVSALAGCLAYAKHRTVNVRADCAGARSAAIEALSDLGYAVVGVYEPMPGRMAIIAAEKTTPSARFRSNVTLRCGGEHTEVTAAQPTFTRREPHFAEDFRAALEGRAGWVVRPIPESSGALEVTRSAETARSAAATTTTRDPANTATARPRAGRPAAAVGATRLAASETPPPSERIASVGGPAGDRDGGPGASGAAGAERTSVAGAPSATAPAANPTVRFDLLSAADARRRFGADLGPAGLLAGRLGIVNRTTRAYLVSVPLVTLRRVGGESVAPLGWNDARARIVQSPAGRGLKTYDEVSRELAADQVLEPGAGLSGILLYPAADYASVQVLLIDQQSARSERFEGAIPPAPLE